MIVKNESSVIKRCLDSVKQMIDYWVIVDTGSEDGTQGLIRTELKSIPGDLYERKWVDFSQNRNEAMELAKGKGEYLLLLDADDQLIFAKDFSMPDFNNDVYAIIQREQDQTTYRDHHLLSMIRNDGSMEWKGTVYETLVPKYGLEKHVSVLSKVINLCGGCGAKGKDPKKSQKEIDLLQKLIDQDQNDSRSTFYLARAYYATGNLQESKNWFLKRSMMGGCEQEIFTSLLYQGLIEKKIGKDPALFLDVFMRAHLFRPSRHEAIYEIGKFFYESKMYHIAYYFFSHATQISPSKDRVFVESWIQHWGLPLYLFLSAKHLGVEKIGNIETTFRKIKDMIPKKVLNQLGLGIHQRKKAA
jgi:glycosyltransferase involved in cell wall biosynthesis